jgi:hypothetical protein
MRKLLLFAVALSLASVAYGRSGCCSHHGGVCGCACCDGTPLSQTCLPYYPGCGGGIAPPSPSALGATAESGSQVLLSWQETATDLTGCRIEESSGAGAFEQIESVGPNVTSLTVAGLLPGTTYNFRVFADNAAGESPPSAEVTATTQSGQSSTCSAPSLCFGGGRFQVSGQWQTPSGTSGVANVIRLTDDSGYMWFFDSSSTEVVFKVINACSLNGKFWFFAGGLTNVQVSLTLRDSLTGATQTYTNPQSTPFAPIQDTSALSTCP